MTSLGPKEASISAKQVATLVWHGAHTGGTVCPAQVPAAKVRHGGVVDARTVCDLAFHGQVGKSATSSDRRLQTGGTPKLQGGRRGLGHGSGFCRWDTRQIRWGDLPGVFVIRARACLQVHARKGLFAGQAGAVGEDRELDPVSDVQFDE